MSCARKKLSLLLSLLLLSLNVFTESSSAQAALFGDDGNDNISLYCMSRKLRFVNTVVNSQCTQPSGVLHFIYNENSVRPISC